MTAVSRVLIVGGGIGGLTLGVALRRQGIEADLVEIKKDWVVYGVGIIQPNNVMRALDKVGLAQPCVEAGGTFEGWRIHDEQGNVLMDAPATSKAAPGRPPINGITRPKLHDILTAAARDTGVKVSLGVSVDNFQDDGKEVAVTFTTGETKRYDLVVGCDGVYSAVRQKVFGDRFTPKFNGQGVWRYNLPRPADMAWGNVYFGRDTKVGLVPLSPTQMYIFVVTAEPGNPRLEGAHLADHLRHRLRHYAGLVGELRKLIVDPTEVVYKPMETVMVEPRWDRGRIILIGDAAHTTTPHLAQGAAMAIEDAVLLAELLGRNAALSDVFDEFMTRRLKRAKYVVDCSTQLAGWELEEWSGVHNPQANPGGLLNEATQALMEDY